MLKPIFDKDVNFFQKNNLVRQRWRNVSHIKLSKYCDIDARLIFHQEFELFSKNKIMLTMVDTVRLSA